MAGYQLVHDNKPIFFLPGVPDQMEQLLLEEVLPRLTSWYSDPSRGMLQKLLRVFNMDEYEVNEKIAALKLDKSVRIGYYPVFPELHISLTVRDKQSDQCNALLSQATKAIYNALGDVIYGQNQDTMETVVGRLLHKNNLHLAVAESCSGGTVSHKITKVPGSSAYFLGGVTSYANSIKSSFLGVAPEMLARHGAVSRVVADAMARGILYNTGADLALSITGIAGPGGGSREKPVGTVYIAIATPLECTTQKFQFRGSREQIQELTAVNGLDLIRRHLISKGSAQK
jgi:nicotinamide-nucleotide amidase